MKGKVWLPLLPLLLLLGCGNESNRDYVRFYVWGDAAEVANYEAIAAKFEEKTGIRVSVEPSAGSYYDNLNIAFSSATKAPDIFFTESGEFAGHIATGKLLNLSAYIRDGELDVQSEANPNGSIALWGLNDAYRYDGENVGQGDYYAFIKDYSPDFVLWYNKDHIDEYNQENNLKKGDEGFMEYPSSTEALSWDEFLDMSHKLTKGNRYGTMLDHVPYQHAMEWVQQTGASLWTDGEKYLNAEDPNVIKAFQFFTDLQVGEKKSSPVIGPTGIGSGEAFANGNVSFVFYGSYAYSTYHWDSLPFSYGIAPAPTPTGGSDLYQGCSGMIALAINKASPVKDKAVAFLNYYMSEGNSYLAKKGFNIPGNRLIAESDAYRSPESSELRELNRYFLKLAETTHPLVRNRYLSQLTVEDKFGKYFSSYLSNPSSSSVANVLKNIRDDLKKEI